MVAEPWLSSDQGKGARILAYAYNAIAREFMIQLWISSSLSYATSLDPKLIDPVLESLYKYKAIDQPVTAQELVQAL